ncbi:hypothetical protein P4S68_14620 [Pseudoalteromonas sp. Hal099]
MFELDKTKPKLNIKSFLVNKTFKWASFWGGTLLLLCCFLYMSYTQIQKHTIAQQYNLNLALESRIYDGLIFPRLSSLRKIDQFINQQVILQKQEVFAYNQSPAILTGKYKRIQRVRRYCPWGRARRA